MQDLSTGNKARVLRRGPSACQQQLFPQLLPQLLPPQPPQQHSSRMITMIQQQQFPPKKPLLLHISGPPMNDKVLG
jgi:iron only hydrogenase large subunit-like protein